MLYKEKLIVGLDVPELKSAEKLVALLENEVNFFKIGHQLVFNGGLELAKNLAQDGKKIFLDLKLLDIDNTIFKAVENIAKLNIDMLTIHAYPQAMQAAVRAAKESDINLLAVTILTSLDDKDLQDCGYALSTKELVLQRARQAKEIGMKGVVASAWEAKEVKKIIQEDMFLVTPGIRPQGTAKGDQKRVMSPMQALENGATHLVVARPIIESQDPREKAVEILHEIRQYYNIHKG